MDKGGLMNFLPGAPSEDELGLHCQSAWSGRFASRQIGVAGTPIIPVHPGGPGLQLPAVVAGTAAGLDVLAAMRRTQTAADLSYGAARRL